MKKNGRLTELMIRNCVTNIITQTTPVIFFFFFNREFIEKCLKKGKSQDWKPENDPGSRFVKKFNLYRNNKASHLLWKKVSIDRIKFYVAYNYIHWWSNLLMCSRIYFRCCYVHWRLFPLKKFKTTWVYWQTKRKKKKKKQIKKIKLNI